MIANAYPQKPDNLFLIDPADPDSFRQALSGRFEGKMNEEMGRLIAANNWWDLAIGLALDNDKRVAFRASWSLEWAYFKDRKAIRPHTAHFLDNFLKSGNPSVHRHYTKMLYDMYRRGIITLTQTQTEAIAEKTFTLMIERGAKVAVKGWCMELLWELMPRLDWVEEPLRDAVRLILQDDPSPGMANGAAKFLKRMDRRKK